ncbi:MAG: PAS domain S-box protein [Methanosarcina sp.]
MEEKLRKSGIDIIGDIPWGTHFCQFYQTKEDLMDVLIPYFKAGLENNEFCMWVTSQPLDAENAKEALRRAVPDIDIYLEKGQIEIIPYTHWYVKEGIFDSERVLNGWVEKHNQALTNGYDGLRLTGNTFWLEKKDWNDFVDYEEEVDNVLGNYRMIALCTYCLDRCNATEIIDVVNNHQFALIKRDGKWEQIESSKRKKAEEAALQAAKDWEYTFDAVPDLIAIIDDKYRVVRANRAMAARLGVTPEECVGLTCYSVVHGTNEPTSFCPHRQLLKDGLEHTTEVYEDCLGGYSLVSVSPLHDSDGKLVGSVHVARDINERKQEEHRIRRYNRVLEGINRIFGNVLRAETEGELGNTCLSVALEVTGSQIGFVGEVGADGLLHDIAISDMGWEQCLMHEKTGHCRPPGNFVLHGLYGRVINNEKGFFTNNPPSHPDSIGLPQDHPPLTSFLGVPLVQEGKTVGLIAVANHEGGYSCEQQEDLEAIAPAVMQALERKRAEQERARAEEALRESEARRKVAEAVQAERERLNSVLDILPAYVILLSPDYHVPFANRFFEERFGKSEGRRCYEYLFQRTEPCENCETYKVLKKGAPHHWEWTGPDNRNYDIYDYLFKDFDGSTLIMEVGIDITERKRTEAELKKHREHLEELVREQTAELAESEKRFRTLAENSPDVIARFDRRNRHLYANPAARAPYGWSPEEIIGKTHAELGMDPGKAEFWEENNKKVFTTGKPETMEFEYILPQGKKYYFNTRIVPEFVDGEVTSVLAISRDITDIKASEAKLKEARDNLKKLVEKRTMKLRKAYRLLKESEKGLAEAQKMAHLGNWDWNIVTGELYWSDEIYRIFGRTPQEFNATYNAFLSYIHPEDRGYVNNAVKEAFNGKPYSVDHRIILAHGEERIVHEQAEVIFDEDNIPIQMKGTVQDITERKKTEKALEVASKYNRTLIEASVDPLVTIGSDGKITDVNHSTEIATGHSRDELIGTDFSDYFTKPEKAREGYKHVFEKGLVRDYPLEIRHKDGHIIPVLYNASVYRDEAGEVIGVFAAAHDVTELKRAEEKIQILANTVESSDDAIITMSLDGVIISWNNGAEQVYGYSVEEIVGRNISVLELDNRKGEIKQLIERIEQGEGIRHYETLRLKKDSTIINVSITLSPVIDSSGKLVALSAIARDITENRKSEEALRLSNIYNRSLIEASLDPLVTIGPDGKITDVNRATEMVTGYSRDELIGTDFTNYFTDPEKAREGYKHVFQEGLVRDYALEIRCRDGHITPVLYNASVYRDESGEIIGIFAAARDITERKKAEKMLELKLEELARSNADLEQFAYVSSHDLQEPLRMIASYLQLLQRKYQGELDDKADKYIYFAVDGASRMQNLINDLLEFSRVTTKAREFEPVNCEFVLNQVLSDLETPIKESGVAISYDPLPEIMADDIQLTQVFQNLISNAIKFCSKEKPKIYISAEKESDQWLFSVQDNGIGIDPKYSERIFEVFKRLNKREEYPGTGIGLSICKKIVERHGGHIWVESELGNGSTFYFTLPINPGESQNPTFNV